MKKTVVAILLVLVLLVTGCSKSNKEENKDTIRIGMLASLTGNYATQGAYARNSADLAVEEINANGGVLGKKIEVVIEDDLGTDEGAVTAYNKLASDKSIVAIIGSGYSTLNLAVDQAARQSEILTTSQGSNDKLGHLGNPWHYQVRTPDGVQVTAGVRYGINELGLKNWAIINATDAASVGQADAAIKTLDELNIKHGLKLEYNEGTQDFTSHLVQIKNAKPEAVFLAGNAVEGALLMTQFRQMGIEAVVIGSNAYSSAQMLELVEKGVLDGVYSATHYTPETPREVGKKYTENYFKKTNVVADAAGALVYDHVYLIAEAIKNADSTDRVKVRDAFVKIDGYAGAVTDYAITSDGGAGTSAMIVQNDGNTKKVIDIISLKSK